MTDQPPQADDTTTAGAATIGGAPVAPARKRRWITPTLAIVAALAVGVVGGVLIGRAGAAPAHPGGGTFARGQFGTGQSSTGQPGAGQGNPGGGAGGAFAAGGFTSGTIVSVDGGTIVVKAQDGTQKTITTSKDTKVTKTDDSTVSALKAGQTVTVIGSAGSGGDVAATSISEGAAQRGGFGGRPGGGTRTGSGTGTGTGSNG